MFDCVVLPLSLFFVCSVNKNNSVIVNSVFARPHDFRPLTSKTRHNLPHKFFLKIISFSTKLTNFHISLYVIVISYETEQYIT